MNTERCFPRRTAAAIPDTPHVHEMRILRAGPHQMVVTLSSSDPDDPNIYDIYRKFKSSWADMVRDLRRKGRDG